MKIFKLDLHGVRHEDARNEVIRFIEKHFNQGVELEVITGNSMAMRSIALRVIEEYDLQYNIGRMFELDLSRIITWV